MCELTVKTSQKKNLRKTCFDGIHPTVVRQKSMKVDQIATEVDVKLYYPSFRNKNYDKGAIIAN